MTKIIDNFNLLSEKLFSSPLEEGEFYFVQILVRGKDGQHNGKNNKNRLIRFYVIKSKEKLLELKEEIVTLCRLHNARAYIHATPREDKAVATEMLKDAINEFTVGNYHVFRRLFSTACGRVYSTKKKTFLVDLDDENANPENVENFKDIINECRGKGGTEKIIAEVPTKHGVHLICHPFDICQFEEMIKLQNKSVPDVHKNNPTLLYFETKEN